jgi:uncharacterized protein YqgC (DUF456 family)
MIDFITNLLQISFPWVIFLLMLLSLFAQIIPLFPGGVIVWLLALLFGYVNPSGFESGGAIFFSIISILMIGSVVADNLVMGGKAKKAGASWFNILLTLIAVIIGTIFTTPIGGIVICASVLFLLEFISNKDAKKAWKITKSLLIGFGWSSVIRMIIVFIQISTWGIWATTVY